MIQDFEKELDNTQREYQWEVTKGWLLGAAILAITLLVALVSTGQWKFFFSGE